MITYNFTASQPLTAEQLEYLNKCLQELPGHDKEDFLDIPETVSEILEVK